MKFHHHVDYSTVGESLPALDCGDCPDGADQRSTVPVPGLVIARVGEGLLAAGLACLTLGVGLFPFTIIGLLGILFFGAALALLITAGVLIRDRTRAFVYTAGGLVAFLVGTGMLCHATGELTAGFQQRALHAEVMRQPELGPVAAPEPLPWAALVAEALAGAVVLAVGLRLRAGWSTVRTVAWALAALVVVPAAVALFLQLATFL